MITFSCSNCGKRYKVKPEYVGKKTTCNKCGNRLIVPIQSEPTQTKSGACLTAVNNVISGMENSTSSNSSIDSTTSALMSSLQELKSIVEKLPKIDQPSANIIDNSSTNKHHVFSPFDLACAFPSILMSGVSGYSIYLIFAYPTVPSDGTMAAVIVLGFLVLAYLSAALIFLLKSFGLEPNTNLDERAIVLASWILQFLAIAFGAGAFYSESWTWADIK
jgi:hypothetical protein